MAFTSALAYACHEKGPRHPDPRMFAVYCRECIRIAGCTTQTHQSEPYLVCEKYNVHVVTKGKRELRTFVERVVIVTSVVSTPSTMVESVVTGTL